MVKRINPRPSSPSKGGEIGAGRALVFCWLRSFFCWSRWCYTGRDQRQRARPAATSELTCQRVPQNPRNRCPDPIFHVCPVITIHQSQALSIVCVETRCKPDFRASENGNFLQIFDFRRPIYWHVSVWSNMEKTFLRWNSILKMCDPSQFAQSGPYIVFWIAGRAALLLGVLVALVFSGIARAQFF